MEVPSSSSATAAAAGMKGPSSNSKTQVRAWQYDMCGHTRGCVEYYCAVAGIKTSDLREVSTPNIDDHQISQKELEENGVLAKSCASIVLKILYTAE